MPIPASQIVEVNPRVIAPGGNDLDFNGLLLSSSDVIPLSQFVLAFASAEDVGSYFGLDSTEYSLAQTYFQGYDNSFSKPTALMIAAKVDSAKSAFVRGGALTYTLAQLQAITDGTFQISLGGTQVELSAINLQGATSFSGAAVILQNALQAWLPTEGDTPVAVSGATVTYSSTLGAFTVTSGEGGLDEGLTYPTGTIAQAFAMSEGDGAVLSAGSAQLSPAENMQAIVNVTRNFVCFMSIDQLTEEEVVAYSDWAAAQGVNYLHVFFDTNIQNTAIQPVGTIAQALTEDNAGSVCGIYAPTLAKAQQNAVFILSIAACVDYDRTNGTITFMFKGQSGLGADVQNGTVASALNAIGMNFIGNYATRNDNFIFLANGEMWGDWKWIDAYLNAVWLNNALQVSCMAGFKSNGRVPYTEEGYAIVRSWCMDPINRALRSGVIEPGVTLSESQKAQLQREAGLDISVNLFTDGYYLQVLDPAPAVRQERGTPQASLWYTYGGSIHRLVLASTAVV